jgi:hypothetical protein
MKKYYILVILTLSYLFSNAQNVYNRANVGLGMGINYGGFGFNISGTPIKYLSISIFGGYNIANFNAGAGTNIFLRAPEKTFRPNIKIIYGCNGAIIVKYTHNYNDNSYLYRDCYYGPSVGLGFPFMFGDKTKVGFDLDIFYPFRSQDFYDCYDRIKRDQNIELDNTISPVTFSLSFHVSF